MLIKLGAPLFVNSIPLIAPWLGSEQLLQGTPREVNALLEGDGVDVALISSKSFLDHGNDYVALGSIGIGATRAVQSVCLFRSIQSKPAVISVPAASATSTELLRVLCREAWGYAPRLVVEPGHMQLPMLLIGDRCLAYQKPPGVLCIDLATAWYELTGLPMVFALFAAKRTVYEARRSAIDAVIAEATASARTLLADPIELACRAHQQLPIGIPSLVSYFETIDYELTPAHYEGLQRFKQSIT